jgi:hypothetical protein
VSLQRRRGQTARIWKTAFVTDNRGNVVVTPGADGPHEVRAVFLPQRSARAEVPGQQQINVMRMLVPPDLPDVNLWSRVEWGGAQWDIVSPPAYHHGIRRATRHWSIDIRQRP